MNDGFVNEKELREYINDKKFATYNKNIKDFLTFLFGSCFNDSMSFVAQKVIGQVKPDLCITHNGQKKYVSIKKGSGNSVHQESIDVFFPYIKENFDEETLDNIKLFHYGDDTLNDTGILRYNANECKAKYVNEIKQLNSKFNLYDNLIKFLDRFLFVGNVGTLTVDAIYHGTIRSGLWASREEIINYVVSTDFSSNSVHFGPMTYQVWGRNEKGIAVHPDRRYIMQVKWGSLLRDLTTIREEND